MSDLEVRVLTVTDWAAFRDVRLRALAGDPDAFGMTYDDAARQPDQRWQDRVVGGGPVVAAFAPVGDGRGAPVGMGGLFEPPEREDTFVWGMWVDPALRGRGVGSAVLRLLVQRSDDLGRPAVLHVTEGNPARRLYTAFGFAPTGHREPLREGSPLRIEELRRPVGGSA